jgi:thioesterase domain-containing protein
MSMSPSDKRAVLRASGVPGRNVPRPREGLEELDRCLKGYMEEDLVKEWEELQDEMAVKMRNQHFEDQLNEENACKVRARKLETFEQKSFRASRLLLAHSEAKENGHTHIAELLKTEIDALNQNMRSHFSQDSNPEAVVDYEEYLHVEVPSWSDSKIRSLKGLEDKARKTKS